MAEEIIKVERFSIEIPHRTGEGARILDALAAAKVNLVGLWAYPLGGGETAKIEIVPLDSAALKAAAKAAKIKLNKESTGFHVVGKHRAGVLASVLSKLAAAGVNVRAVQASSAGTRFGCLLQVEPQDVRKASKALGL